MRWRFVDRIEAFEPWAFAKGRKAISFEEYSLLKPLGRKGVFPNSLSLEGCIHLARWLVMRSSDFEKTCLLLEVSRMTFRNEAGMGQTLSMTAVVRKEGDEVLAMECEATEGSRQICQGALILGLMPLCDAFDPETMKTMWHELYGKT